MKTKIITIATACFTILGLFAGMCFADDKATVEEVYAKVIEGVQILEELGEEGLEAFNGKEFVWKDTYIGIVDCEKKVLVATPTKALIGATTDLLACKKTGKNSADIACQSAGESGLWIEYYWPNKAKEGAIERRLSFTIIVPNSNYLVIGSVWDDDTTTEELNKSLN